MPDEGTEGGRRAVLVASLATVAMGSGPLVHYGLSALGPAVVDELSLSTTDFGLLWFVTFGVAGLSSVLSGRVVSAFSLRVTITGVLVLALGALVMVSGAPSRPALLVAAGISGLSQALSNPATNVLVASLVPPSRQGMVVALKQSGVQISQMLAGVALPSLAVLVGWRYAILSPATVIVLGMVATFLCVPVGRPRSPGRRDARPRLVPDVHWMAGYAFLMGVVIQATNVHLPLFAHRELEVSLQRAGLVVAVLGGVGIVGRMIWARQLRRIRDLRAPLAWSALLASGSMLAMSAAGHAGEWLMWVGASVFSVSALASNVIIAVALLRIVPAAAVARATGYTSMGMFGGFMAGPLAFGLVVDSGVGYPSAWVVLAALCVVLVVLTRAWPRPSAS